MNPIIFISDLHIDITDIERVKNFLAFLQYCQQRKVQVYILGDLFNFWAGNAQFKIPVMKTMIEGMLKISQHISIYFLPGNRDFLFPKFWEKIGGKVAKEGTVIELENKRICLYHGDSFYTQDIKYQRIRSLSRQAWVYYAAKFLPTFLCIYIGRKLRKISQSCTQKRNNFILKFDMENIHNLLKIHQSEIIICGHIHYGKKIELPWNKEILFILPECIDNVFRYLEWDGLNFNFQEYKI